MIQAILAIAREAGELIMAEYGAADPGIALKADESPLTRADLASHHFICTSLAERFSLPIISEEHPIPYEERRDWERFWLVDPLDGTKDFIARNGEFTVNIALIHRGRPELGVLYAPAVGELFFAVRGQGAFCLQEGRPVALPARSMGGRVMTCSRFHEGAEGQRFAALNQVTELRPAGSALKFARVASGEAHVYPRFVGSSEWDIAAGHLIVTESGGQVLDLVTGEEPAYNKVTLRNHPFMVTTKGVDPKGFILAG